MSIKLHINARPNLNGNSPEHFIEAVVKLNGAARALKAAISEVRMSVTHGRNYQTYRDQGDMRAASRQNLLRNADDGLISNLDKSVEQIEAIADAIFRASKGETDG